MEHKVNGCIENVSHNNVKALNHYRPCGGGLPSIVRPEERPNQYCHYSAVTGYIYPVLRAFTPLIVHSSRHDDICHCFNPNWSHMRQNLKGEWIFYSTF